MEKENENVKKEENVKEIDVKEAGIDVETLDIMKQEDIMKAIESEDSLRRFELNCYCEFLGELKKLKEQVQSLSDIITVCGAEKISAFFGKLKDNMEEEEKIINFKEKLNESHKKKKKKVKIEK